VCVASVSAAVRATPRPTAGAAQWFPALVLNAEFRVCNPPDRPGSRTLLKQSADPIVRRHIAWSMTTFAAETVPTLHPDQQAAAEAALVLRIAERAPDDERELARWTLAAFGKSSNWIDRAAASGRQKRSRAIQSKRKRRHANSS